jgi:hypothetical protein
LVTTAVISDSIVGQSLIEANLPQTRGTLLTKEMKELKETHFKKYSFKNYDRNSFFPDLR